jgi:hypothetical protein
MKCEACDTDFRRQETVEVARCRDDLAVEQPPASARAKHESPLLRHDHQLALRHREKSCTRYDGPRFRQGTVGHGVRREHVHANQRTSVALFDDVELKRRLFNASVREPTLLHLHKSELSQELTIFRGRGESKGPAGSRRQGHDDRAASIGRLPRIFHQGLPGAAAAIAAVPHFPTRFRSRENDGSSRKHHLADLVVTLIPLGGCPRPDL